MGPSLRSLNFCVGLSFESFELMRVERQERKYLLKGHLNNPDGVVLFVSLSRKESLHFGFLSVCLFLSFPLSTLTSIDLQKKYCFIILFYS